MSKENKDTNRHWSKQPKDQDNVPVV